MRSAMRCAMRLAETWTEFRRDSELEVAIFTGAGRAFCAGEDMKESLRHGAPGGRRPAIEDPFMSRALEKPVIAAVNGYAIGRGFMLVSAPICGSPREARSSRCRGEALAARRLQSWACREPALPDRDGNGARLPLHRRALLRDRLLDRLVDADQLIPSTLAIAEHLLTLPPASRVNTVHMMRQMRPVPSADSSASRPLCASTAPRAT